MIEIFPEVEFSAQCPSDGADLDIIDMLIPGMRCLANATCPKCSSRYYIDLPISHALWSPVILDQKTTEVYDPVNVEWFSNLLKEGFLNPVLDEIVPIVHKFFDADRIIILNCLDFLYGHCLLKLLNVQRYLDNNPDLGCCVLVPTQLVHLVPDGVAEIWEFPLPIKEGWKWYPSLQNWLNKQIATRKECFLSPVYSHPSNRVYDLRRFVRNLPDVSAQIEQYQPIILFSYREDRPWGRTLIHQQSNLQKLYNRLSAIFPNMAFVLVGFGQKNQIRENGAKLIDVRAEKFELERDRRWLAYMKVADCAVGVHGSNMLLPSGLAKSTVELVPKDRLNNSIQDFLFPSGFQDIRDPLLYYRLVYGNELLSDVFPSKVASLIATVLSYSHYNSAWFSADVNVKSQIEAQELKSKPVYRASVKYLKEQSTASSFFRKIRRFLELLLAILD